MPGTAQGLLRFAQFLFPVIAIGYYLFGLPPKITDPFPSTSRFTSQDKSVLIHENFYPVDNAKATVVRILFFC